MPSRILPLSEDAISQLHSSKQITSLQGVVIALLENALDAGSTKVNISVNFGRGSCTVEDNGSGIPSEEFLEHGGLGKLHHTSKAASELQLHDSAGAYLASLASLSLVTITSRHVAEESSATLSIHQGRVIARHIPSPPASELIAFGGRGTRISVNDLFGNMPVRIKQRALSNAQGANANERSWLELKREVAGVLLAWKMPCSIRLRDDENQGRNLTLSGSHSTVSSDLTKRNLDGLHGRSVRYDLRDAFPVVFQVGLAPFESRARWVPVSASTTWIACRGLICLDPAPTRLCQFVSIGIRSCSSKSGLSVIYEALNKAFSNSSFGTVEEKALTGPTEKTQRSRDAHSKAESYTQRQTLTSKSVDRWPMFVLQLELKGRSDSIALENDEHQLKSIVDVLEATVEEWLAANNFRPRKKRKQKAESPVKGHVTPLRQDHVASNRSITSPHFNGKDHESMTKRRRLGNDSRGGTSGDSAPSPREHAMASTVDHFSRIRSGRRDTADTGMPYGGTIRTSGSAQAAPIVESKHFALPILEPGSLGTGLKVNWPTSKASSEPPLERTMSKPRQVAAVSSDDFGSISDTDLLRAAGSALGSEGLPVSEQEDTDAAADRDEIYEWKDPITKETFKVNSRTGIIVAKDERPGTSLSLAHDKSRQRPATTAIATTPAGRPLTLAGRANSAGGQTSNHAVPTFLQDWQNPVFERQSEPSIPIASLAGPGIEADLTGKRCTHNDASDYFAATGQGTQSKLSKASLQSAKVISQVDAKFILCSMPTTTSDTNSLVLVDQHAASERIILESLLTDLFSPIDTTSPAASLQTNTGCSSDVSTTILEKPMTFEITPDESAKLLSHAPLFARYGILYDLHTTARTTQHQHHILAALVLPPAIAERCRLFPKLLIDLLRSEIWSRTEIGRTAALAPNGGHNRSWLARMGSCPKALLDMLNSRACRSAVMFNDVLGLRECENLVSGLARCEFPFMCAHGRVSMVPVGVVGGEGFGDLAGRDSGGESFVGAWRRWKGERGRRVDVVEEDV